MPADKENRARQAHEILAAMLDGKEVLPKYSKPEDFGGIAAKEYTLGYFVNHPDRFFITPITK